MTLSPELLREVEDLALRVVVVDRDAERPTSEWLPSLKRIRDAAVREGANRVGDTAAVIIGDLERRESSSSEAGGGVANTLLEGVTRLQQATELERQQMAACDLPPAQDPELLSDFILESREHLAAIEA